MKRSDFRYKKIDTKTPLNEENESQNLKIKKLELAYERWRT